MRDTLVLNASFEPLSTVTLNRAVVLVLQDKAVVEHAHPDLRVRAAAVELPVPRVIRLCRYVRVPFRRQAPWSRRGYWSGTSTGARTAAGARRRWTMWCRGPGVVRTAG